MKAAFAAAAGTAMNTGGGAFKGALADIGKKNKDAADDKTAKQAEHDTAHSQALEMNASKDANTAMTSKMSGGSAGGGTNSSKDSGSKGSSASEGESGKSKEASPGLDKTDGLD